MSTKLADIIRSSKHFELVTPQSLSLVTFRLNPLKSSVSNGHSTEVAFPNEDLNEVNAQLASRLDHRSDVFITSAMLYGIEGKIGCLRIQTGGYRTTMDDVEAVWRAVQEEGEKVLSER